jgi:hypothetical protein
VTGGRKLGMMMARPNWAAVCGTTVLSASPSRTCRCKSSGRVNVNVVVSDAEWVMIQIVALLLVHPNSKTGIKYALDY